MRWFGFHLQDLRGGRRQGRRPRGGDRRDRGLCGLRCESRGRGTAGQGSRREGWRRLGDKADPGGGDRRTCTWAGGLRGHLLAQGHPRHGIDLRDLQRLHPRPVRRRHRQAPAEAQTGGRRNRHLDHPSSAYAAGQLIVTAILETGGVDGNQPADALEAKPHRTIVGTVTYTPDDHYPSRTWPVYDGPDGKETPVARVKPQFIPTYGG